MPEALINFVALLGWAPSNSAQELFTMQQLIDAVPLVSFRSPCALSVSFIVCVCLLVHFICVLIVLAGLGAHAAAPLCVINPHTRFDTFYFPFFFLFCFCVRLHKVLSYLPFAQFSLEKVHKAGAAVDFAKLTWMNNQHWMRLADACMVHL